MIMEFEEQLTPPKSNWPFQNGNQIALDAIQLHGGYGYSREFL